MIEGNADFERIARFKADIVVVGAGPVGIITALALAGKGLAVILLESGGQRPDAAAQGLSGAINLRPDNHHAPEITVSRQLGGTSNLWGGRCLPYDPIDYAPRPWLGLPGWAIGAHDLDPYMDAACSMLGAGSRAQYRDALTEVSADGDFSFDSLERWSNVPRAHVLHGRALEETENLLVVLGATAIGFLYDAAGRIEAVDTHIEGKGRGLIDAPEVVLAAGGNESTRLLLAEQRRVPGLFGDKLGRNYMGHLAGTLADVEIHNQALHDGLDFHVDRHGSYVRRRIVPCTRLQADERLANIAFWPVVPEIFDPRHRSGPLSAVFLALSIAPLGRRLVAEAIRLRHVGEAPHRRLAHIVNMLRDPIATMGFAPWFLWKSKFSTPRLPGLFIQNPARRYGLEYHSEHLPSPESRLTLSGECDRLGQPRLAIDLRFSGQDANSIVRAHGALDEWLTRNQLARLIYRYPAEERSARILAEAKHGNHQIGTIPMGNTRCEGIVDRDCRTFDVPNLSVVSTAVLPTSGHGNPTMAAVQLGLRLADRVANERRRPAVRTAGTAAA
ncbi:MAG: hypothetical protein RLZ98_1225 [Pseudomonadota bacterium]